MGILYRIKGWSDCYENNRTRELKTMQWVPIPARLDGDGYTELLDHKNGAAHYGIWVGCVIVASRCDPRGTLLRDTKKPFCESSLSRVLRIPSSLIGEALNRFVSIGWLETEHYTDTQVAATSHEGATIPQDVATISHEGALNGKKERKKGSEWKEETHRTSVPDALDVPEFNVAWSDWLEFRRTKRKPVSDLAAKTQLADLARYGPATAIQTIRDSIKNDWQGLFPEKSKNAQPRITGAGQQYRAGTELGPV